MNSAQTLELVVLEGEQAGASTTINAGTKLSVGATLDNDIVLRDPGLSDTQIEISLSDGSLDLSVTSGEVDIAGGKLVSGEVARIQPYTMIRIGSSIVAYGEPGSSSWRKLRTELQLEDNQDPAGQTPAAGRSNRLQRLGGALLSLFIGLGVLLVLSNNGQSKMIPVTLMEKLGSLEKDIQKLGFHNLTLQAGKESVLSITGYLDETRQRVEIENLLEKQSIVAKLEIQVGEELAAEVKDIYRVQGIDAEVDPLGQGRVRVVTREMDIGHLQQVKAVAIRDAGVDEIVAVNEAPELPLEAEQLADPGAAVTMVVAGDPAYVVTTEQSRYFLGSLLPTGHRIAAITETRVLLEKAGTLTTLSF